MVKIDGQHHIDSIIIRLGIMPLPDALADVFLIIIDCQLIQCWLRCKIANGELNTYTHLGLEDAAEELRRMEEAEAARREQEKLAGKAKDAQKLFKAV